MDLTGGVVDLSKINPEKLAQEANAQEEFDARVLQALQRLLARPDIQQGINEVIDLRLSQAQVQVSVDLDSEEIHKVIDDRIALAIGGDTGGDRPS